MHDHPTTAVRLRLTDTPDAMAQVATTIAAAGGTLRTVSTPRLASEAVAEVELEVAGLDGEQLATALAAIEAVVELEPTRPLERVFGKRIIVIGGGA